MIDEGTHEQRPFSLVTNRDIVKGLAKDLDLTTISVHEIMRARLVVGRTSDDEAGAALRRMRVHGVRCIWVLDDTARLTGIRSLDELPKPRAAQAAALADIIAFERDREHCLRRCHTPPGHQAPRRGPPASSWLALAGKIGHARTLGHPARQRSGPR